MSVTHGKISSSITKATSETTHSAPSTTAKAPAPGTEKAHVPATAPATNPATAPSTATTATTATSTAAAGQSVAPAANTTPSANSSQTTPSIIGLLPTSKTITITFVPDWDNNDKDTINSPARPVSLLVLLGPANTLPTQAPWSFEFNLFGTSTVQPVVKEKHEEPITKAQRALLWYDGKPTPKYKNSVVQSGCSVSSNGNLFTHSIALRTHAEDRDPNALVWVPKSNIDIKKGEINRDLSHLRLMAGHHYYLNITFKAGSIIAQMVGQQSWRPIMFLYTKGKRNGIVEKISSRLFTNFTCNWAQGIEPNVDERELKLNAEALQDEAVETAQAIAEGKIPRTALHTPTDAKPHSPASVATTVGSMDRDSKTSNEDLRTSAIIPPSTFSLVRASTSQAASAGGSITHSTHFLTPKLVPARMLDSYGFTNHSFAATSTETTMPGTAHVFPLQKSSDVPVEWSEVEDAITKKPLQSIVLPSFECREFAPDFSLAPIVERFVGSESTLALAMCAIEGLARTWTNDLKNPLYDAAKHLLNCFSAISQLPGWLHVQNYILNPQLYIERTKSAYNGDEIARQAMARTGGGPIDDLHAKGQTLLSRLYQRIDWLLELQRKAAKAFDPVLYMKVIAADRAWAEDASTFMKKAENDVTEMLTKNPQKFHAFRELQRKGVQWPHSPMLRIEIERAGFVFRPMMIKRDRCVCETCGVEVSGWKAYHNPWSFHNYAKHPATFQPGVAVTLQPPTSPFVAQMVTDSNMRRGNSQGTGTSGNLPKDAMSASNANVGSTATSASTVTTARNAGVT